MMALDSFQNFDQINQQMAQENANQNNMQAMAQNDSQNMEAPIVS